MLARVWGTRHPDISHVVDGGVNTTSKESNLKKQTRKQFGYVYQSLKCTHALFNSAFPLLEIYPKLHSHKSCVKEYPWVHHTKDCHI